MTIATHIIDITGGTVYDFDALLNATIPSGASIVSSLNAQLGSTVWQGGGSGTPAWGSVVGTLSDQTDLQAALDAKADDSHTHELADLTDVTVAADRIDFDDRGVRPGLFDDLDSPPVGAIIESVNDGHLYWIHRDGSRHLLCDSGGYGGGHVDWGDITGTLSFQSDLQAELDDRQPLNDNLTALAGLATYSDTLGYFTGSGTAAITAFPNFGRVLVSAEDDAIARSILDAQQESGALTAIAGLTFAADKGIYFTGSGTASTFTLTTAGRALLDDTSAAGMRSTLGLVIGTNVQAYSSRLTTFETILVTPLAHASQAAVSGTAGASYTSTEQALINDLVTLVNRLRSELVTARIIKGSA